MKNIKFNYSKYYSKVRDLDLFETIIDSDGKTIIQQKQIKEIYPRVDFFNFEYEIGDIYLLYVNGWMNDYYIAKSPKGWPGNVSNLKLDPGIYHVIITNIYNGHIFFRIKEIEESLEECLDVRNGFPSTWYFDINDLPESKVEFINIYDNFN